MIDNQTEVVFIEFDKVLMNPDQLILHLVGDVHYEVFKDSIDMTHIRGIDVDNALRIASSTTEYNPLEALAIDKDIDWDRAYYDLLQTVPDRYELCETLPMYKNLLMLASQKFVTKIYVYTRQADDKVYQHIDDNISNSNIIEYVYGDIGKLLDEGVVSDTTSFILGDIRLVPYITERRDKLTDSMIEILIAGYRFNKDPHILETGDYTLKLKNDEGMLLDPLTFKPLTEFRPVYLDERHYTQYSEDNLNDFIEVLQRGKM